MVLRAAGPRASMLPAPAPPALRAAGGGGELADAPPEPVLESAMSVLLWQQHDLARVPRDS
ncbi:MAG TPA: hypothetical protein VN800_00600, partial [Candidatus Acidoferrales bacterium]|nr:hypothetical protein [Candidatus Acidoferrales bacterium]